MTSITLTLTADQLASIDAQRAAGATPVITPVPAPAPAPAPTPGPVAGTLILPWSHTSGLPSVTIGPGEVKVFAITPPAGYSSHGGLCNFSISPTDMYSYVDHDICLSDTPGDFSTKLGASALKRGQEPNVYFSVGGYPSRTVYGHTYTDTANPDLTAGRTYYVSVRNVDQSISSKSNYGLAPV